MKLVSIIIRTKNEERWIESCLKRVYRQEYKNLEVIIVDNISTDHTLKKIRDYDVKIINIEKFKPGEALNIGIRASKGEIVICLSGHCIPASDQWLTNLIRNLDDKNVGGVYGRQEPLSFTSDVDKRDLLTVFRNEKVIQKKDSFFHNANSAFRREVWEKFPFDETVTNIEDRIWGRKIIDAGMHIVYEPEASVYHWHGINHGLNQKRAQNIVGILEKIEQIEDMSEKEILGEYNIIAIVPIMAKEIEKSGLNLLKMAISSLQASKYIGKIFVTTDEPKIGSIVESLGAEIPILRPKKLSDDFIGIGEVLRYTISRTEERYGVQDFVVYADVNYPLRSCELADEMIEFIARGGYDSVIAVIQEDRAIITRDGEEFALTNEGFMPKKMKRKQNYIGLAGLITVTRPVFLREGELLGPNLGIYKVESMLQSLNLFDNRSFEECITLLNKYILKN